MRCQIYKNTITNIPLTILIIRYDSLYAIPDHYCLYPGGG